MGLLTYIILMLLVIALSVAMALASPLHFINPALLVVI